MQQGDLGVVRVPGTDQDVPNPLGMSIAVSDVELAFELLADTEFQAKFGTHPLPLDIPFSTSPDDLPPELREIFAFVDNIGKRIAVRKARAILQRVDLDIADRPIDVKPVMVLPDCTKFHVLSPIVVLAEQERPCPPPDV